MCVQFFKEIIKYLLEKYHETKDIAKWWFIQQHKYHAVLVPTSVVSESSSVSA